MTINTMGTVKSHISYMERIDFLKNRVLNTLPEMDLENAKLLTQSFMETGGLPWHVRKAKAFQKQCEEKSVKIWDRELIVGCSGSKIRAGILCADTCWSVLDDELETISTRRYDPFYLTEEDKKIFLEIVKPFWKGRSNYEKWLAQIPEDVRTLRDNGVIYIDRKAGRGWGETTAGYSDVINKGIKKICEEIKAHKDNLDMTVPGDYKKITYLDSLLISGEAIISLANRYSEEAARLAAVETDLQRKEELLEISRICAKVPAYPAETFHEAIQAFYLYQICIFMEQNAASYNPGRMDQYFYPFFKADMEAGRLTEERAQELLNCLWVKFSEPCLFQDKITAEFAAGYPMFQNVTVGGVDTSGRNAVNELSYMILQASMEVQLYQPSLSVRYSLAKNPTSFLRKVVELIKMGTGFPAFHNDDIGIRMLMNKGIPLKEAFDWNPSGCVETNLEGRLRAYTALADINLGSMVEFTLLDGKSRKTGLNVSVSTGDPSNFTTFEEFVNALKAHLAYAVRTVVKGSHLIDDIGFNRPVPALSLSFRECVENALDYAWGGAKYNTGNGIILIGIADLINSMAAVRHLVFDTKRISMQELLHALDTNFEDSPEILRYCKDAPKYGNDIEWVDNMAADIFTYIADEIENYRSKFGVMTPGILPVSGNTPFGLEVGALPSGRPAWKPLADGVSPNGGTDFEGPSAVLKSVSKLPHDRFVQGTLLNMKIEPSLFASEAGIQNVMVLLKTLCTLNVYHAQFNVIDQQKLIDAQKHPEDHKGLLVRVAGYTAYFTELGKDVQDEIIGRTMQSSLSSPLTCG